MSSGSRQKSFLILYGSQTGQAEAISEQIEEAARTKGFEPRRHCMCDNVAKFELKTEDTVVIIVSSTGDGEPPENAFKFWKQIRDQSLPNDHLQHLHFALLGLGDSNYNTFGGCPKMFDKRLQELSAKHFYKFALADDGVGLEIVVEPWIEGLWSALSAHLKAKCCVDGQSSNGGNTNGNLCKGAAADVGDTCTSNTNEQSHTGLSTVYLSNTSEVQATAVCSNNNSESSGHISESDIKSQGNSNSITNSGSASSEVNLCINSSLSTDSQPINSSEATSSSENITNSTNGSNSISAKNPFNLEQDLSLTRSQNFQSEVEHRISPLPPAYINIISHPDTEQGATLPTQGNYSPIIGSQVHQACIKSVKYLTKGENVKKTICLTLDVSKTDLEFAPGDAFRIIPQNSHYEVSSILERLGVLDQADNLIKLEVLKETKKKVAAVPLHLPKLTTYRFIFTHCLEIRATIKKGFLRVLAEFTSDLNERKRLEELSSRDSKDYTQFVVIPGMTLLDLLMAFPSLRPPVARILEHLPKIIPRSYSLANCPLQTPGEIRFVFNVVEIGMENGRQYPRLGVCTGWLHNLVSTNDHLACQLDAVSLDSSKHNLVSQHDSILSLSLLKHESCKFHLPVNASVPLILIGPGVGVAPFIGFLQRREVLKSAGVELGTCWLFYGCRHQNGDYLFREELDHFRNVGVLSSLLVCFSRDIVDGSTTARYVQDNITLNSADVAHLITDQGAAVYVCGDAKNMAKDVNSAICDVLQVVKNWTSEAAEEYINSMKKENRYLQDVWM